MRGFPLAALMAVTAVPVGGCASVAPDEPHSTVEVARRVSLRLPSANELTQDLDAVQLLAIEYDGERHVMQAHVELRPGRIVLVLMDAVGVFMLAIEYDGVDVSFQRIQAVPSTIPMDLVLADFLLAYLPAEVIANSLLGGRIDVADEQRTRRILRKSRPVIEIRFATSDPWSGPVEYVHLERGYRMVVETVDYSSR